MLPDMLFLLCWVDALPQLVGVLAFDDAAEDRLLLGVGMKEADGEEAWLLVCCRKRAGAMAVAWLGERSLKEPMGREYPEEVVLDLRRLSASTGSAVGDEVSTMLHML